MTLAVRQPPTGCVRQLRTITGYELESAATFAFRPCGVQPLSQRLTARRMLILAKPQEIFGADFPG